MSSTDSDAVEKVVGMPSEPVVDIAWNEWTASIGIGGRHGPDYALTKMQALGALMNKLLRILWALMKHQTFYDPTYELNK